MSFLSSLNISASGMTAQRLRLDIASENIANIETTRTEDGTPYRRKMVVLESRKENFRSVLGRAMSGQNSANRGGVAAVPPLFCRMSGSLIRPLTQAGRKQLRRRELYMAAIRKYPPASHSVLSFTAPVQKLPSIILCPGRLSASGPPSLMVYMMYSSSS